MESTEAELKTEKAETRRLIAPWWHTALMVLLIVGLSFFGARNMHHAGARLSRLAPHFIATIAFEWALAALAWWGIKMRGVPRAQLLGVRALGARGWLGDAVAALVFWVVALFVLAAVAQVLEHFFKLDPAKIAGVTQKLAPTNGMEMVLFLILSISAGICEEFVFRGYFQQQFGGAAGSIWIGVAVSALLFGCAHGYEGIAGMLLIAAYGAMFSVLALQRRGLRAGMIAHAWHDSVSGVALVLLRHHGLLFRAK